MTMRHTMLLQKFYGLVHVFSSLCMGVSFASLLSLLLLLLFVFFCLIFICFPHFFFAVCQASAEEWKFAPLPFSGERCYLMTLGCLVHVVLCLCFPQRKREWRTLCDCQSQSTGLVTLQNVLKFYPGLHNP